MADPVTIGTVVLQLLQAAIAAGQTLEQLYLRVRIEQAKESPNFKSITAEYRAIAIKNFDEADAALDRLGV